MATVGVEREAGMRQTYTAVIKQSGSWWIGWIKEVPGVNCQERTREDLLETLKITLKEALEFNRRECGSPIHSVLSTDYPQNSF